MYKKQTIMRRKQISERKCDTKSKGANSIKCTIFEKKTQARVTFSLLDFVFNMKLYNGLFFI